MKNLKKVLVYTLSSLIITSLVACSSADKQKDVLRFGVIPFESAEELIKNVTPMMDVISKGLDMEVKPFIAADYTGVIEAFRGKKLDAAFLTPASYVMGKREANVRVILKSQRNGNPYYYGVIIARTDSGINTLNDLKGKKFSFGDPLSTSGYVFPKKLLLDNKINPETDFSHVIFSGTHDATVLAILNKKVDAGATFSEDKEGKMGSWTKYLSPEEIKQIKVIGATDTIPSDNICVSADLDPKIADKLADVIIEYGKTEQGKAMMKKLYKFDGYLRAKDEDYEPVRAAFESSGIDLKETIKKKK
jgi:phosphonate transport system substrate-binding protein